MTTSIRTISSIYASVLVFSAALTAASGVSAETIALIGTGNVAGALGPEFAMQGHDIVYGSRNPDRAEVRELVARTGGNAFATRQAEAAAQADIVVIAVPGDVAEQVVASLGDLSGKIIIDPINPRIVGEDGFADYPTYTSNAERIQNLVPNARVVKAFSTISADTMINPGLVDHPLTMPLVGNDPEAKAVVAELCEALGFETLDFGPVRYAHIVEGLYLLRINARRYDEYFEWNYPRSRRSR